MENKIVARILTYIGLMVLVVGEAILAFFGAYGCGFRSLGISKSGALMCDFGLPTMFIFIVVGFIAAIFLAWSVGSTWATTTKRVLWIVYLIAVLLMPLIILISMMS